MEAGMTSMKIRPMDVGLQYRVMRKSKIPFVCSSENNWTSENVKPVDHWIKILDLQAHPEGGYFRETYRASEDIPRNALPDRFAGSRSISTAIYFLLTAHAFSAFHRIRSDELWHFHTGASLTIHILSPDRTYHAHTIGPDGPFQAIVPAQSWFAAEVAHAYALVSCTVAPGFDFEDFELADRAALIAGYPQHRALIERLTRP